MVRHERRPNLVLWLITIWRRGSQERERPLTLDRRTRGWSKRALGGVQRGPIPPAGRPRPFRPRPRGHGRRGKHVRRATAAPSGVWTGGWGTTGTPRTAGRPLRSRRDHVRVAPRPVGVGPVLSTGHARIRPGLPWAADRPAVVRPQPGRPDLKSCPGSPGPTGRGCSDAPR